MVKLKCKKKEKYYFKRLKFFFFFLLFFCLYEKFAFKKKKRSLEYKFEIQLKINRVYYCCYKILLEAFTHIKYLFQKNKIFFFLLFHFNI